MEDHLLICLQYLRKVETRLLELQLSPTRDLEERASRHEAIKAVSQTHETVEGPPEAFGEIGWRWPRPSRRVGSLPVDVEGKEKATKHAKTDLKRINLELPLLTWKRARSA